MPLIATQEYGYTPEEFNRYPRSNLYTGKFPYFDGSLGDYSSCGLVKYGQSGNCVMEVQGYLIEAGIPVTANGIFGSETLAAVLQFQATRGLRVDGEVGQETWPALTSFKPAVSSSVTKSITPTPQLKITPTPSPTPMPITPTSQPTQSFLSKYLPYILIGGGGLLIVYFLTIPKYAPEIHERVKAMIPTRGKA